MPTPGEPRGSGELDVRLCLIEILQLVNGSLDSANLAPAAVGAEEVNPTLAALLGITAASQTRRGKSIIATEEARTNTAYGLMTTPDRVSGIVLPTDGLICVAYVAAWKSSVASAGSAAIFLGASQASIAHTGAGLTAIASETPSAAHVAYRPLTSCSAGLFGTGTGTGVGAEYTSHATTGQVIGVQHASGHEFDQAGICQLFAAAGTYDVSVQFKSSSGSVSAKERKLWVWTMGF